MHLQQRHIETTENNKHCHTNENEKKKYIYTYDLWHIGKGLQKRISPAKVTVLYIVWWWLSANRLHFLFERLHPMRRPDQTLEQNVRYPRGKWRDDKHEDNAFDLAPILSTMQTGQIQRRIPLCRSSETSLSFLYHCRAKTSTKCR